MPGSVRALRCYWLGLPRTGEVPRIPLLKPYEKSGEGPNRYPTKRRKRLDGAPFRCFALPRNLHKGPPTTFHTVSEEEFSEVRGYKRRRSPSVLGSHRTGPQRYISPVSSGVDTTVARGRYERL